jgi:hypothetical protein
LGDDGVVVYISAFLPGDDVAVVYISAFLSDAAAGDAAARC